MVKTEDCIGLDFIFEQNTLTHLCEKIQHQKDDTFLSKTSEVSQALVYLNG